MKDWPRNGVGVGILWKKNNKRSGKITESLSKRSLRFLSYFFIFSFILTIQSTLSQSAEFELSGGDVNALILAINTANSNNEADTITLDGSLFTLTSADNGSNGLPVITSNITIIGNGSVIERNSANNFRILDINGSGDLLLDNVTIAGGRIAGDGGGILNNGVLAVLNSTVSNNTTTGNIGDNNFGGGIYNNGSLSINKSTINGNISLSGGGIYNNSNSNSLEILNSTIYGNLANNGGGIFNFSQQVNIVSSTITGNRLNLTTSDEGAGIFVTGSNNNPAYNLRNTIIADNQNNNNQTRNCARGGNVNGELNDNGFNFSNDNSCLFGAGNNAAVNLDPNGLQDNGGPTFTVALCTGVGIPFTGCAGASAALDAIPGSCTDLVGQIVRTDQTNFPRPFPNDGNCDSGSFESQPSVSLTIRKETTPSGGGGYDFNVFSMVDIFLSEFSLNHNQDFVVDVPTGPITISEIIPPEFVLQDVSCSNILEAPVIDFEMSVADIILGTSVNSASCTFTNALLCDVNITVSGNGTLSHDTFGLDCSPSGGPVCSFQAGHGIRIDDFIEAPDPGFQRLSYAGDCTPTGVLEFVGEGGTIDGCSSNCTVSFVEDGTDTAASVDELVAAIQLANFTDGPDVITLVPGLIYTLTEGIFVLDGLNGLPPIESDITINGNGAIIERDSSLFEDKLIDGQNVTLTCNDNTSGNFRTFFVNETGVLTLNDITIRNGCIMDTSANIPGSGSNLPGFSNAGGAIFSRGILNINRSTFINNNAFVDGGAIFSLGELNVFNSNFTDNRSRTVFESLSNIFDTGGRSGGAIFLNAFNKDSIVSNTTFRGNRSVRGGAISVQGSGSRTFSTQLLVSGSTFDDNTAELITLTPRNAEGGAIHNRLADLDIINSTFVNNSAEGAGGALYVDGDTPNFRALANISFSLLANNFTFGENGVDLGGGGISVPVSGNDNGGVELNIRNSIIAFNTTGSSVLPSPTNCNNLDLADDGNYSDDSTCGFGAGDNSTNITLDTNGLQQNGGNTETVAIISGDTVNGAGAGCAPLEADGSISLFPLGSDQRGFPRPFDGACDAGPYEFSTEPFVSVTKIVRPSLDSTEFAFDLDGTSFMLSNGNTYTEILSLGGNNDHTITETNQTGFTIESIVCNSDTDVLPTINIDNSSDPSTATVDFSFVNNNDNLICIFSNLLSDGFTLSINKIGLGTGTVTSTDGLINCGADCDDFYLSSTDVTLQAFPDLDSEFVSWVGDCPGSDSSTNLTVDRNSYCTAIFDLQDSCDPNPCLNGGECTDGLNSFTCDCSDTGFEGDTCEEDLDECVLGTDNCDINGTCINTPGSFFCQCDDGSQGASCEIDINECEDGNNGGCEQICDNTAGSFNCDCFTGFELNADGFTCDDISGDDAFNPVNVTELIEAIQQANVFDGPDIINLVPDMVYTLVEGDIFLLDGVNGLPPINSDITINGNGAVIERDSSLFRVELIDGENVTLPCDSNNVFINFRAFNVTQEGILTLNDVTIRNGCVLDFDNEISGGSHAGGAILNNGILNTNNSNFLNNNSADDGGAIFSNGTLSIKGSSFNNNNARITFEPRPDIFETIGGFGGAVYQSASNSINEIINSTFSGNSAVSGGGVYVLGSGSQSSSTVINISGSTFDSNTAEDTDNNSSGANGGGLTIFLARLNMINSTLVNNSAEVFGGGIYTEGDSINFEATSNISFSLIANNSALTGGGLGVIEFDTGGANLNLRNSIIAFNTTSSTDIPAPANCNILSLSGDGNYIDDDSCGIAANPEIFLDTNGLQFNGGPTQTIAVSGGPRDGATADCAALGPDGSVLTESLDIDQRGFPRPFNSVCDSGPFEFRDETLVSITKITDPTITGTDFSFTLDGTTEFLLADGEIFTTVLNAGSTIHTITENNLPGFDLANIECEESTVDPTINVNNSSVTFVLENSEDSLLCTFTNTPNSGFTLDINKLGNGTGTVTSQSGINCGTECSQLFDDGTEVILEAFPDAGSVFAGWGGDCTGTTNTTTITIDRDSSCTATFDDIDDCVSNPCQNGSVCTDTGTDSFSCDCSGTGFDGDTCDIDIDECALDTDNCDVNAACTNTPGSFSCGCNAGFEGDGITCTDIDDCSPVNPCANGGICSDNGVDSFLCDCSGTGFEGNICDIDVDECGTGNGGCEQICINNPGGLICGCEIGFELDADGTSCNDIDECAQGTDNCNINASCTNTPGDFTCECNDGFTGDGVNCVLTPAGLTISKITSPAGGESFEFRTFSEAVDANNIPLFGDSTFIPSDFNLNDTENVNSNIPGDESVFVFEIISENFILEEIECTTLDGSLITSEINNSDRYGIANVDFVPGDAVECRFSNTLLCDVEITIEGSGNVSSSFISDSVLDFPGIDCSGSCTRQVPYGSAILLDPDINTGFFPPAFSGDCDENGIISFIGEGGDINGCSSQCTVVFEDIDECAEGTDNCDINAACTNTDGGFSCGCNAGFEGDGITCTDIDDCASNPCENGGACTDGVDSFTCDCDGTGHEGDTCAEDIDECVLGTDNCDINAACTNTPGSFSCACNQGYEGDGLSCTDINDCSPINPCANGGTCSDNGVDSFICECSNTGFEGTLCDIDIDECVLGTDNCDINASCTNTPGGFSCECNDGFAGDGVTCENVDDCSSDPCQNGGICTDGIDSFSCDCTDTGFGGPSCENDIDECVLGTDNCDINAACTNTPGDFTCECNNGFTGDGIICTDIDECVLGTDNCDINASCTNTPGGFSCECNDGFAGDGVTCENVDDCSSDPCQNGGICTDGIDSFSCDCTDTGFGGPSCENDIDECELGTDNCDINAACTNTPGDFTCECNNGFTGDGIICTDIDECVLGTDNCDINAACTNTDGSFSCECIDGFAGDGVTCENVDDCSSDPCQNGGICTDGVDSFSCDCTDTGFGGPSCENDIDECAEGTDNCDINAVCTNNPGGFDCECNNGFTGDGINCVPVGDDDDDDDDNNDVNDSDDDDDDDNNDVNDSDDDDDDVNDSDDDDDDDVEVIQNDGGGVVVTVDNPEVHQILVDVPAVVRVQSAELDAAEGNCVITENVTDNNVLVNEADVICDVESPTEDLDVVLDLCRQEDQSGNGEISFEFLDENGESVFNFDVQLILDQVQLCRLLDEGGEDISSDGFSAGGCNSLAGAVDTDSVYANLYLVLIPLFTAFTRVFRRRRQKLS